MHFPVQIRCGNDQNPEQKSNAENLFNLQSCVGFHATPRTESRSPWIPDSRLIVDCPNLLAICSFGAGHDVVDVDACTDAGISVCNQSGANAEAVAEHTLGFMLMLSKKVMIVNHVMRSTPQIDRLGYLGADLLGKTVGIVGLGNIGTRVAQLCSGLCHHCPLTDETSNLIAKDQFCLMKPTAYFVNTSRGGTYDEPRSVQPEADCLKAACSGDHMPTKPQTETFLFF
ncbi:MAG: hypothetical protein M9924_20975 [Rhizobiaceae bacterium]|nr:hypothetical protein [Rhizobiaceae bacterium]